MPLLDKILIINQIKKFFKTDSDILIPQHLGFIEPLHAIYSKNILENLTQHIKMCNDKYSIRGFLPKTKTEYFQITDIDIVKKAFKNINTNTDLEDLENLL